MIQESKRLPNPLSRQLLESEDDFILEKVKKGELHFYEVIVRKYNERLFRVAWSILKDEEEVREVLQESYIKAFEKLDQFKGNAQFSTWLTRILINTALAKARAKRISEQRMVSIDKLSIEMEDHFAYEGVEQKLINQHIKRVLEKAINDLPDKYRLVFMMRAVEDMNVNDTAECLDLTAENVKIRFYRAKRILREGLKNDMNAVELFDFKLDRCNPITDFVMNIVLRKHPNFL